MSTHVTLERGATPVLRFTRRYPHPRAAVWAALTTADALSAWFPCRVGIDARPGGSLTFRFPGEEPQTAPITAFEPPHTLAFTWDGEDLRWTLEEDGDGCVLRLANAVSVPGAAPAIAAGWDSCLAELAVLLDGGTPAAHGGADQALIARYRAEFDVS